MVPSKHDPGGVFTGLVEPLVTCEILPPSEPVADGLLEEDARLEALGIELIFLPDAPQGLPRGRQL